MLPPRPKGQGLRKPKKDDLDHTKFWKAVAENRSENAVAALETMIEETE